MELPTFSVRGAADDVGEFGLEAGVRGVVLAHRLESPGTQGDDALQWGLGPQAFTLMNGQCCGVIDQQPSILHREGKNHT